MEHKYTQIHTNTHKHTQKHTNTHKHTQTHTNTHKHTQTHTHKPHTHTHKHTHTEYVGANCPAASVSRVQCEAKLIFEIKKKIKFFCAQRILNYFEKQKKM